MSVAWTWGTTAAERAPYYACDRLVSGGDAYYRAVDVAAPPASVFRWLCQLRVAPYSYDKLDNRGRRSPRSLTPGLDDLEAGQRFMTMFRLAEFVEGEELTLVADMRGLGHGAVTYAARPAAAGASRLIVKVRFVPRPGLAGRVSRVLLPWGDLLMMRRQLLNLADLAAQPG